MNAKQQKYLKTLRVTQLDAQALDQNVYGIFAQEIKKSLHHKPFTFLLNFEPEINSILQYILWKYSLGQSNSTIGQSYLNTEFKFNSKWDTNKQKKIQLASVIFLSWIKDRQSMVLYIIGLILKYYKRFHYLSSIEKMVSHLETLVDAFSFANLLTFIYSGNYVNLLERLLGWQHIYKTKPSPRYIDYEYMRTELLRSTVSDTLFVILPLINFHKIINSLKIVRKYFSSSDAAKSNDTLTYICGVCNEKTVNPHTSDICGHMFCYYCIQNYRNINNNNCPVCNYVIEEIVPAKIIKPNS